MRMVLHAMTIQNFKGCKHAQLDFSDGRNAIHGMNATGKTTIVDAFCWCLWNQDSHGNAPGSDTFREKPLDENGEVIHNLETSVELNCTIDGQRFDVKRMQTENWVKKRGNAEATFQGNVSTYWVNGVETKAVDFKARIKLIADEDRFRLIASLGAFNALDWKKRRAALLALSGEDVDGELLARDEYRPLADMVAEQNISVDDLRKVLTDKKRNIDKELKILPVKIAERKDAVQGPSKTEVRDAEYLVETTRKDIAKIEDMIADAKAAAGTVSKRGQILSLESEIVSIKRRMMEEHSAERRKLNDAVNAESENVRRLSSDITSEKRSLESSDREQERLETLCEELRAKYREEQHRPAEVNEVCPTCGQAIPADKVEEARRIARENRKAVLAEIQTQGKAVAAKIAEVQADKENSEAILARLEASRREAEKARSDALEAVARFPIEPDFGADTRLLEAQKELDALKAEQDGNPDEKVRQLTERKRELLAIVDAQNVILARRDVAVENEERVRVYTERQKELGAQQSETELLLGKLEHFVTDRCSALEQSINIHFPTVRWKLFDTQINGGIVDCCVALLDCDGVYVPYESANTAAQIAADVEIIDALSKAYDVRLPLFVDNAERINVLPEIDSQVITLAVSTDHYMRIVREGNEGQGKATA